MNDWLTTILIFLPMIGALVVWLLPLPRHMVGSLATLASLVEVGLWVVVLERFDFGSGELQFSQQHTWFSEINSSYHVGLFAFSVWLVGLTAVCGAAACIYAWWVGRERPRAYFGLLLFLTGAVVGVFAAQDLLLFYAFFEAMLIPLYVMIGFWGGAGRLRATITFVVYTVAGSLLMLAAIIVYGLQQGSFDLTVHGDELERLALPRLRDRLRDQGAVLALPRLAARRLPRVAGRGVGSPLRRHLQGGRLRLPAHRDPEVPRADARLPCPAPRALRDRARVRLPARVPRARHPRRDRLLVPGADGLDRFGLFAANDLGFDGSVLQMVNHGLLSMTLFLLAGMVERRTATGELSLLGGMARGRPALATILMTVGVMALAVPLSSNFAGEFLILAGVFQQGWGWAVVGAVAIVLAAMYSLRLISAVLHRDVGPAVSDAALDLRTGELAVVVPLVAILLVLSAWPDAISGHSFSGTTILTSSTSQAAAP